MTREDIARIIKESRLSAGLTQLQVAQSLGRPQQTIASWESGKSQPDANTLFELFRVLGRSVDDAFGFTKQSFEINRLEREHIEKYRTLDTYGKDTVSAVLECEHRRCTAELEYARVTGETDKLIYFSVPYYSMPMSAGTGQEAGQEYPENYTLVKKPPRGTSFIACVSDDSMEPTYHDGDMVFVHSCEEIPIGRIGTFFMDGQQWIKILGNGVLLSRNPAYPPLPMTEDIRCQGLVLGVCDKSYFESPPRPAPQEGVKHPLPQIRKHLGI